MAPSEPMQGISDTINLTMAPHEPMHQSVAPILAQQTEPNPVQEWPSQSLANSVLIQYFTLVSYVLGKADNNKNAKLTHKKVINSEIKILKIFY